jgi:hypothetical protein
VDSSDPSNVKFLDTEAYDIENYKLIKSFRENGYWSQNALSQTDEATRAKRQPSAMRRSASIIFMWIQ